MAAGVPGTSNPNNPVVFFDIAIGGQVCICKIWIQFFKLELFYLFGDLIFFCLIVQATAVQRVSTCGVVCMKIAFSLINELKNWQIVKL